MNGAGSGTQNERMMRMKFKSKLAQQFFDENIAKVESEVESMLKAIVDHIEGASVDVMSQLTVVAIQTRINGFRKASMNACELELAETRMNIEAASILNQGTMD